mmetsp:Transcript_22258/g.71955  ORF Transcript_22258/g.71955 Transcript_22258/m.71955 type:complete len:97 (+) Transcript_22258:506-796(+)
MARTPAPFKSGSDVRGTGDAGASQVPEPSVLGAERAGLGARSASDPVWGGEGGGGLAGGREHSMPRDLRKSAIEVSEKRRNVSLAVCGEAQSGAAV